MQSITFLTEFLKHPRYTGAVAPSSQKLATRMADQIDYKHAQVIVELGPGTGSLTKEIIRRKKQNTRLILIEINQTFAQQLEKEYNHDESITVIHGSAENIEMYLTELSIDRADAILSGLPFSSLPDHVSRSILTRAASVLRPGGNFITFQYSLMKKQLIQSAYPSLKTTKVWFNLPPAYVMNGTKKEFDHNGCS